MGIENIKALVENDDEEYHVVIVGRGGGHPGTDIYLAGPGPKRAAINTAETKYRESRTLRSNIALVSRVVFSGNESGGIAFIDRMTAILDDKKED